MDNTVSSIPNLRIDNIGSKKKPHYMIVGFINLPCWNGYYLYDNTYKLKKDKVVTDGRIGLSVDGVIDPDNSLRFTQEQVSAYQYLVEHQQHIKDCILITLKKEFPRLLLEEYASWDREDPNLPKLSDLSPEFDFKNYIGPESISIGEDARDGAAYITWYFRCCWDIEHGFQVITHKERVIEIAPDTNIWNIYKDNGTYEQQRKAYNDRTSGTRPTKQKKWWQFW